MSRGHIPLRTCVFCRTKAEKQKLLRLCRKPSGEIVLDSNGELPGRGTYLCNRRACWQGALEKNKLGHSLRGFLSEENKQLLLKVGMSLSATDVE